MFLAALLSGLLANTQLSVDPAAWRLHLCRNEIELMPVDLKVAGPLKVAVGGAVRCMVLAEKDYRLEPLEPGQLLDPKEQRLWLSIQAPSRPGVYKLEIRAGLEGAPGDPAWDKAQEGRSTVTIRVWPVELPAQNNFDFDPYYPGVFWLAGGHDPTEENIRRLEAHLRVLKFLRTTCCNWIAMPWELAKRAKIAGGKPLPQAAKERPGVYGVQEKPPLDFSDLDPFCRLPQKYGLTRIRAYFDHGPDWRIETLCETVSGRKYPAESKEARSIQVYLYSQLARYWKSRGFGEVYCKISDEIGPDWVDEYIRWGQVVREAGLRPYTTITSWLPFVPELLQKMNPVCDQWQVAVGYMRQMRRLTQPGWKVRWVERELNGKWGPYTNGGAQETWALSSVFPEQDPPVIVSPQLTVDGHPLQLLAGPWGNRRRGVWATWASSVYISLPDGSDPNATTHRIVLRYGLLEPAPGAPPLLKLDDSDWLIFYGGGSKPYTHSYNSTRAFPWNMALHETDGYAFWCYQWYPETERLGWLDDRLRWTPSPAFEGLRDGNEDMALYFAALQVLKRSGHRKAASKLAERLFGDGRILEVSRKVYAWPLNTCTETVAADNSYRRFQEARAILLQIITGS